MFGSDQKHQLHHSLIELLRLTSGTGQPNINALWMIAKDIEGIKLNIKAFGYDVARSLASLHPPLAALNAPLAVGLKSKPSVQADMQSAWAAYWCKQLQVAVCFHRKVWEYCYLLQGLFEADMLRDGVRGLGFGCGEEPIPSLLAQLGCRVTVTDLEPAEAAQKGWVETAQHASSLESCHHPHLVSRDTFLAKVEHSYADMNAIPSHLRDYDFCWSLCSLEHLGSIRKGLDFIEASLETLRPGGIAIHTTEFNYLNDKETIDNWPTVLFQRRHFEDLSAHLIAKGHAVAPLDFDTGAGPMDRFIDLPPYAHDLHGAGTAYGTGAQHLKLMLDGFAATCFGIIIRKAA